MSFCPQCGTSITPSSLYCTNCGRRNADEIAVQPAVDSGRQRRPRRWVRVLRRVLTYGTTFVVGTIAGAALVIDSGQSSGNAVAIAAVLDADTRLYALVDSTEADRVSALAAYIDGIGRIDTSPCPNDFREAYFRYVNAWGDYHSNIVAKSGAQVDALAAFLTSLFVGGGMTSLGALEPMLAADPPLEAVTAAWTEVQAVAIRHGVTFTE